MKKLIFLFTLSLLMISMTWATTYTENFDTVGNWAGGTAGSYNAKTYTNSANPANDGFSSNSAVRESSDTHSSGYAWRVNSGAYYFRYECAETVNGFSVYMARWDNSPVPSIAIRYSTNSGSSYTDIETITGAWFTGDKAYKQYTHTFTSPITPTSGNKIYIELNKTTGERLLVDDFELTYGSAAPVPTISVMPASLSGFTYVHNNGPSAAQSFAVTGSNLTSNLSVSSTGTNYVISATAGGSYGTSLSLTQSGGAVSATVYVKLNSGLSIGDYNNENITVSGGGSATSPTVTCSGTVTSPPPPNAPTATAATAINDDAFTANWNAATGATGYKLDVYKLVAGSNASDLFISEYIEGSSNNKAIEIYNGTGQSVSLDGYYLKQHNGGNATPSNIIDLTGYSINNNDVFVVANTSANATILGQADLTSGNLNHNGNDAVGLYYGDTLVDIFGLIGTSSDYAKDVTLVRKAGASVPKTTYSADDWDSYGTDETTYLGSHNFSGGSTLTYVTGFENKDVSNVTSYEITGLTQNTTYYYVVRAYNAYGTSDDSNEIEVTTTTSSPLITLSTDTLSDFYYVWGHGPSSEQTFTVSGANLTANISIAAPTNYEISLSSGSGYTSPLTLTQSGGTVGTTTVYVRLKAGLVAGDYNEEVITASSTGATNQTVSCSGSIEAPLTTEIPYSEDFSEGLTGVYTYSVTGTKVWTISSAAAQCNGYQSSAEEHWLILPGINFNDYTAERMTFNTSAYYGAIDANNYLALMYSTDYFGLGDPTSATWTEITFANGGVGGGVTPSGVLDISDILGDMVFLAFIYYSTDQPTSWNVDDINIYEAAPLIVATSALDTFSYKEGSGPSDEQSFTVSGADLTADIVITAPSNYEISQTTGESFVSSSPITLTESSGSVAETTIYVRLKSGLDIGTYDQDITIASTGATGETISCNGEVTDPSLQVETFASYPESSTSYNDGTFTGMDGSTWTYVQCAGSLQITGKSVTLGKDKDAEVYSGTIHGGIGTLSFDYMQAFQTNVSLEVYVNETLVETVTSTSQQSTVLNSGSIVVDQPGDVVIRFYNPDDGGQVVIDNVTWTPAYDIPEDEVVTIGGAGFLIYGGSANINTQGVVPGFNNPSLVPSFSMVFTLTGNGPWDFLIETDALFGAYYRGGAWTTVANDEGTIMFNVEAAKDMNLPIILGDADPNTLPVELSTFTVTMNAANNAVLTWVTQTETGVSGFYVYRNSEESLATAKTVSNLIPATNTSQQQVYQFTDKELYSMGTYYYWLQISDMDGSESFYGPLALEYEGGTNPGTPTIPQITELKSIYPNPFNPSTTISYGLAEAAEVKVQIFNSRGQLVRNYNEGQKNAGNYTLIWNGTDNNGQSQATGVYFVRLQAGKKVFNSKAVLMK